jgi:hypothetical protein
VGFPRLLEKLLLVLPPQLILSMETGLLILSVMMEILVFGFNPWSIEIGFQNLISR